MIKKIVGCMIMVMAMMPMVFAQDIQQKITDAIVGIVENKDEGERMQFLDTLEFAVERLYQKDSVSHMILGYLEGAIEYARMMYDTSKNDMYDAMIYNNIIIDIMDAFSLVYDEYYYSEGDDIQPTMDAAIAKLQETRIKLDEMGAYKGDSSFIDAIKELLDMYEEELTIIYPAVMKLDARYVAGEVSDQEYDRELIAIVGDQDQRFEAVFDKIEMVQETFAAKYGFELEE